jgi:hypothetical protein
MVALKCARVAPRDADGDPRLDEQLPGQLYPQHNAATRDAQQPRGGEALP